MNWKRLERITASILGGKRNSRGGDFSQSICDVSHDSFSIECKYRSNEFKNIYDYFDQAVSYDKTKNPILVIQRKGRSPLAVMLLSDLGDLYEQSKKNN